MFKKATRTKTKLRLLLEGASGSGKTYSALLLAKGFGGKTAVIDTEKGSASLYTHLCGFDVCELEPPYTPEKYVLAVKEAEKKKYETVIIDSVSHEWNGEGGCLDLQSKLGGRYQDWATITPRHQAFINCLIHADLHIIGTVRTKADYLVDSVNGKMKVSKVGTKAEQRDGLEFEFTTVLRLNQNNMYEVSKDRTGLFVNEGIVTEDTAKMLIEWLDEGEPPHGITEEEAVVVLSTTHSIEELREAWATLPEKIKNSRKILDFAQEMKTSLDLEPSSLPLTHENQK